MPLKKAFFLHIFFIAFSAICWGQDQQDGGVITYDPVNDDPYALNRLYIHLQPLYGELFVTNVNVGFGIQVDYQAARTLDLSAQWRRAYARPLDFTREVAVKNQDNEDNTKSFNYLQFGGTLFVSDKEEDGQSKIIMYSKRYRGSRWANRIPERLVIPSKVRKVYGIRWGGLMYNSTTDVARAAKEQGATLVDQDNNPVVDAKLYGNVDVKAVYLGASLSIIKNVAIKPHRDFGVLVNDLHFNIFADIIYAPSVEIDNLLLGTTVISGDQLETQELGFRAGVEGKFNKKFGYSYGTEFGYRPSLKERGFFLMFKLGFPVFGIPPQDQVHTYRN